MIRVGIAGITGYTGEELLKILSKHPFVKIAGIYGRNSSKKRHIKDIYPYFSNLDLETSPLDTKKIVGNCDVVFLALPHAAAFEFVPSLLASGVKVIDLSADFRLKDAQVYEKWYKVEHLARDLLSSAAYGLAELNSDEIRNAKLVANPGCYPTTIILACAPIIKYGVADIDGLIIDSKSAISGAGRKASEEYFKSEYPNFKPYKIAGEHRHIPEIEQELSILSGRNVKINFTPHIIPMERGMLSTIYANMKKNISTSEVIEKYREFYDGKNFIKILDCGFFGGVKDVLKTNYCQISAKVDVRTNKIVIISAIDNLVKGASGQAVQNMNIMFGLDETVGLI
jgi:N-acetyl-gamma-glutamyl-phosphate reductase